MEESSSNSVVTMSVRPPKLDREFEASSSHIPVLVIGTRDEERELHVSFLAGSR